MKPLDDKTRKRVFGMPFADLYPLYVAKVERKGRTTEELDQVLRWLTGYTPRQLEAHKTKGTDLQTFLAKAKLNPDRSLITGVVCGVRVEDIEDPTMQGIRYMDKLVDELAKGKAIERILRKPE